MANIKVLFGLDEKDNKFITIDKIYIDKISSLLQSTSDPSVISYGLLANSGSLTISDGGERIKSLIDKGSIGTEDNTVFLFANGRQIRKHISQNNTYNKNTKKLFVSLENELSSLDTLKYKGFPYPEEEKSLYFILEDIFSCLGYDLDKAVSSVLIYGENNYKTTVGDYLKNIIVKYPEIPVGTTYREAIDMVCRVAQLQAYVNDSGDLVISSSRPVFTGEDKVILINKNNIFSDLDETIILKNKYDAVEISETIPEEYINYKEVVASDVVSSEDALNKGNLFVETGSETTTVLPSNNTFPTTEAKLDLDVEFFEGSIIFDKITKNNLSKIIKAYDGYEEREYEDEYTGKKMYIDPKIKHLVTYETKTAEIDKDNNFIWGEPELEEGIITEFSNNIIYGVEWGTSGFYPGVSVEDKTNIHKTKISLKKRDNGEEYYQLDYVVAVSFFGRARGYNTINGELEGGTAVAKTLKKLEVSIYGDRRLIEFDNVSANSENIETAKNVISLEDSKLLQPQTVAYGNHKASDIIKSNILKDYKEGVVTARITVGCGEYKYSDGTIAKKWEEGDVLSVGDLVSFKDDVDKFGDLRVWRITGVEFIHESVPLLALELMNVRKIFALPNSGLYDVSSGELIYSWSNLVENGYISFGENQSTITNIDLYYPNGFLVLPDSVSSLNNFRPYLNLSKIFIPSSVTKIGNELNLPRYSFDNVEVSENNKTFDSRDNCNAVIKTKSNALVFGSKNTNLDILNSLTEILDYAFAQCRLSQHLFIVPDNIIHMGRGCFASCDFSHFVFGRGMSTVPSEILRNCKSLKSVYIPKNIDYLASEVTNVYFAPFFGCDKNLIIYFEADSVPSRASQYWNYYSETEQLSARFGYTMEEYLAETEKL